MNSKVLFFLALTFCFGGIVFGQEVLVKADPPRGYLIGPGDVISVKVVGEKDFDIEAATVDEDGKIKVPFSNTPVMARCKTEMELSNEVAKIFGKYLRDPQINLRVAERKSRPPATIYGEVRIPQKFDLTRQVTLLEILSQSGGVTEKAGGMVQVTRTQPPMCGDESELAKWSQDTNNGLNIPSSLYSLSTIKQAKTESNPIIYPGDIIVVMKAPPVYVIGEVNAIREILITENGLSLTEAIAQAGGFNREAKKKEVTIQRINPKARNKRENIYINYELVSKGQQKDIMLEPEDIVIINKTKKSVADTLLDIITGGAKSAATILPTVIL